MCGRAALTASPDDLREAFGLDEPPVFVPSFNIPPSRPLEVLRVARGSAARRLEPLRWGLVPPWAKNAAIGSKLALARVETAATSNAFRESLAKRRCLVAVDGFYEWRRDGKSSSVPFFIARSDRRPFALAGIWSRWVSNDGEVVESCALLTQPARAPLTAIHDRIPIVLERAAWDRWIDPSLTDPAAVADLLAEPPTDDRGPCVLVAYAVGPYVNDPRHDDAACLEPARELQQMLFES